MNPTSASWPAADHPLLQLLLTEVMQTEFALLLRQTLKLFTVGDFLSGWCDPRRRPSIEQVFDQPRQAWQAAATCAAWLGVPVPADRWGVPPWWCQEPNQPPLAAPSARKSVRARAWAGWISPVPLGEM